jgi:pyruvate dehydrogenase phosphatase
VGGRGDWFGLGASVFERCGMLQALMNLFSLCLKPFGHGRSSSNSDSKLESFVGVSKEGKDGLLWYRDVGRYWSGEFSMAVVQANQVIEDQSQIESGPFGTFVGVYDGHGGPEAARFVCDHLFRHFQGLFFLNIFDQISKKDFYLKEKNFAVFLLCH